MRASAALSVLQPALYRAWARVGLSAVTAILIGFGASGCSFSRNGGEGPFAKMGDREATGSLGDPQAPAPTDADLAFARNAASDVLTRGNKDSSQPWSNPDTGARGSVTPFAQAYTGEDGRTCRDFLASYVNGKTESWLQGAACHSDNGRWEIHTLKPWRRG